MSKKGDFEAVRKDIAKLLHQPEYDDGSAGPILVRLAWYVSCLCLQNLRVSTLIILFSTSPQTNNVAGTHRGPTTPKQTRAVRTELACDMNMKVAILRMQVYNMLEYSSSQLRLHTHG